MSDYAIIHNTLQKDPTNSEKEAVEHIYRQLRNAEPPDEETARGIIDKLFFSDQRYNLGEVGRYRMNKKLGNDIEMDKQVLTKQDIITIIKYLIELINSKAEIDDIDHLSNRRVRTVGEQLSSQFGVGLARMARTIRERMNVRDNEVFTPIDLINAKTLSSVIKASLGPTSCHSSWIKPIHWQKLRISVVSLHLDLEVSPVNVQDLRYVTYTTLTRTSLSD